MSSEDKVYCYLQSLDTNGNANVETAFSASHLDTDTGIKVNYYSQSPKDDSSIPYLEISDESPSFKKPIAFESTSSIKKALFKDHQKSTERKIKIIQNVILELSSNSNSNNSQDADYYIPSTSTSTDDDNTPYYFKPTHKTVSVFYF